MVAQGGSIECRGISIILSPMTREVVKSISAWGMMSRKTCAFVLIASIVSIAGIAGMFGRSSGVYAIESSASASFDYTGRSLDKKR